MSPRTALLVLLVLLSTAVGVFLATALGTPERQASAGPRAPEQRAAEPSGSDVPLIAPPSTPSLPQGPVSTSVLWPLRLELELGQAQYLPQEQGMQPIGSGSTARLRGRIVGVDGEGVAAELTFLAGANQGRTLRADASGAFGATDLLPGLSVVDVRGPGILGSRRLVRLRQEREQFLNIGYGRPGSVAGRVVDRDGNGLEGARVTVDGTALTTDLNGDFRLATVAAGEVLVEVEKQGFAYHQQTVNVTGGALLPSERLTIALEPEATLVVSVANNVGGPGPVQVMLLPGNFEQRASTRGGSYPWQRVGTVEVFPGTPVRIEGLPADVVRVHAFRPGALALQRVANLRSGGDFPLEIHLQPAPRLTGVVSLDGEPVAGARVRLQAPNAVRAMLSYFREPTYFLETGVLPLIPPAVQEVETDAGGRFVLTAWADLTPVRYLEVRGPGNSWAGMLVRSEEEHLEIALGEADFGQSRLVVELPGRVQGLPVELSIDGAPLDPFVLEPGRELEVDSLVSGLWHAKASWNGQVLLDDPRLRIEGQTRIGLVLPEGAIEGQDEEAWRRAGRDFPY